MTNTTATPPPKGLAPKTVALVVYALQAATFISGVTMLIAVIINYVKRDDVKGTWVESHFRWQIRTFWFNVLWLALGVITLPIVVGYGVLFAASVWVLYRIIKGWLRLLDGKAMYVS